MVAFCLFLLSVILFLFLFLVDFFYVCLFCASFLSVIFCLFFLFFSFLFFFLRNCSRFHLVGSIYLVLKHLGLPSIPQTRLEHYRLPGQNLFMAFNRIPDGSNIGSTV